MDLADQGVNVKLADSTRLLEVERLSVNYGGIQALQNVDLLVNTGEVVTLIANGAGKVPPARYF